MLTRFTASVDYETDRKIQDTIANEFNDRTILCIARMSLAPPPMDNPTQVANHTPNRSSTNDHFLRSHMRIGRGSDRGSYTLSFSPPFQRVLIHQFGLLRIAFPSLRFYRNSTRPKIYIVSLEESSEGCASARLSIWKISSWHARGARNIRGSTTTYCFRWIHYHLLFR